VSCAQCQGIVQEFDGRVARRELRRFRRRGPTGTTARLLEALRERGVSGLSFLDIGGGVGVLQHELMASGASSGTSVDASPAYLSAARAEADTLGYRDRMRYVEGDFVTVAPQIGGADVVTLDRVVCCYPDMTALIDASASRARRLYGVVLPREHPLMVIGAFLLNVFQRVRRRPFRVFLHGTAAVDARIRSHGLRPVWHGRSFFWQAHLYRRDGAPAASARAD
jgi:2-polyprenyl-3-methyl-5-hydroxy-6-metoxy-1,4-benzoquinol methylase